MIVAVLVPVVGGTVTALLAGGGAAKPAGPPRYQGLPVSNPVRAPRLVLKNYLGQTVNLTQFRGKAVLVTFLYTHCPDVCPLIASKFHTALAEMSATERHEVAIIAVSVDPVGDTRQTVARFLSVHEMTGRMLYLIGSARTLSPVWKAWGVASARVPGHKQLVDHTALIYGITAQGKIVAVYASSFAPSDLVHDVPLLARA